MEEKKTLQQIKYSIIVPIFNSERTIASCMRSVLDSQREDVELILVDNASTDQTPSIISEVIRQQWTSKITYCYEGTGGVSSARNAGLDKATGEYVIFLDSDDELSEDFFEVLDKLGKEELVIYLMQMDEDTKPNKTFTELAGEAVFEKKLVSLLRAGFLHSASNKRFKRDIIEREHLRFDEKLSIGEDFLFSMRYCVNCGSVALINQYLYKVSSENMHSLSRGYRPNLTKQLVRLYKLQEEVLQGCTLSEEVKAELLREMDYWHSKAVCSCIAETFKVSFKPYIFYRKKYQKIGRKFDTPLQGFDGYCSKVHQILNWLLRNHLIYPIYVVTALKKAKAYKIYRKMK